MQTSLPNRNYVPLAVVAAIIAVASVAIPLYVIRPFVPEDPHALDFALGLRNWAPWITLLCFAGLLVLSLYAWRRTRRGAHTAFLITTILAALSALAAPVNVFEHMFQPNATPSFASASRASVAPGDMVLAVDLNGQQRSYPIRYLGYHHIINDTVGGQPIAVTYCTLCHTGLVWSRILDGRTLYFHLGGINNGNALLRDAETSSIWQQSTGECIFGPLRGKHLSLVASNELSFGLWRAENPAGTVLRPDPAVQAEYDPRDWEQHVARTHVVVDVSSTGINPHEIVFGITQDGIHRAYPLRSLYSSGLIEDRLPGSGRGVLLLLGPDSASIRAFAPGDLSFVRAPNATDANFMTDTDTGSIWNFQGCAVSGKLSGRCLAPLNGHKSFWFDWWNRYRDTSLFAG